MQGIPVDEILVWNEKLRLLEKVASDVAPGLDENAGITQDIDLDELAFIKGMESDFASQAEGLLETLHLSHLRKLPRNTAAIPVSLKSQH